MQALTTPSVAKGRRQTADLGRNDRDPVVVELLTKGQCGRRTLVETSRNNRAVDPGDPNRLVEAG
jgi:hypothetical protein